MKSTMTKAALLAAALVVCAAGSARAATFEVKVPFAFRVEGKTLPAGQYRVESEGTLVLLRGEKGNREAVVWATTMPAVGHDPAGNKPALTFSRYEATYQLADIWESGSQGLEVRR